MRALLATDGSPSAQVALELVAGMRWPIGSTVRLVAVVATANDLFGGPWPTAALIEDGAIETRLVMEAEQDLEDAAARLRDAGLRTEHVLLRGRPADEIVHDVGSHRPDLVVVGSRGHSAFDRMLLGSVSAELVDRSPVPVLVARRPTIDRVVLAVDGSAIATEAVYAVRYWPFLTSAEIAVLSIAPSGVWTGLPAHPDRTAADPAAHAGMDLRERHERYAADAAAMLRSIGLDAHPEVRSGSAAHGIAAFADEWHADLIITGSHGRTGLSRLVLGSVARNVLHHATCSVLIVKRHAEVVAAGEPSLVGTSWTIAAAH